MLIYTYYLFYYRTIVILDLKLNKNLYNKSDSKSYSNKLPLKPGVATYSTCASHFEEVYSYYILTTPNRTTVIIHKDYGHYSQFKKQRQSKLINLFQ